MDSKMMDIIMYVIGVACGVVSTAYGLWLTAWSILSIKEELE
jgi:hypothetical protein